MPIFWTLHSVVPTILGPCLSNCLLSSSRCRTDHRIWGNRGKSFHISVLKFQTAGIPSPIESSTTCLVNGNGTRQLEGKYFVNHINFIKWYIHIFIHIHVHFICKCVLLCFFKKMNPHYLLKHLHHDVLFYILLDKRHYQTLLMCWTSILFRYFIIG